MRVTLTQDELFEAISSHLKDKLNLDDTASIEISFTAGRSPKGYTADVDITYPKSALASKFTAKEHADEAAVTGDTSGQVAPAAEVAAVADVVADPTAGGAVPAGNLFG